MRKNCSKYCIFSVVFSVNTTLSVKNLLHWDLTGVVPIFITRDPRLGYIKPLGFRTVEQRKMTVRVW